MAAVVSTNSEVPDLIALVRSGDDEAFVALVERYKPMVFRWAVALAGNGDDAEDITQEVFVRVHRKLGGYRGDGPFEAWLYGITRREVIRLQSKTARRAARIASSTQEVYVTDPGARVDRQRAMQLIREIADALPLRQRELFLLCDLEGRTPAEAAALIGIKDVSARASLFKARVAIRRAILATHPQYTELPQ